MTPSIQPTTIPITSDNNETLDILLILSIKTPTKVERNAPKKSEYVFPIPA